MNVSDFDYTLPEELVAAHPSERRDESRLLVVPPGAGSEHRQFRDLTEYLRPGDLLVMNDSRVIPARLFGHREPGGGKCEVLLLEPAGDLKWQAMVRPGKKLRVGSRIVFGEGLAAEVEEDLGGGERLLRFECGGEFREALDRLGHMPLPPYILARRGARESLPQDRERYQTVYADREGSVAAPTAGLHFTDEMLAAMNDMGVETARVTLHVGAGTFQPIAVDRIEDHPMHAEEYEISPEVAETINRAKSEGRRVIAVGTTSVRTIESAGATGEVVPGCEKTRLMILPGYKFHIVDGMITNFHLPRSTLLCLVAAMIGRKRLLDLYEEAIRERYRFYSYGDAMLILPQGNADAVE
ncbi:tRNA preQ1(34) S-adenosylmethionine ribosyltransferase-isomerase QueA [bacterium]|nr:tRNA preQ1(34) S-adenosylmethionine ribosyltransferase-isomerase QueA [bacterium]